MKYGINYSVNANVTANQSWYIPFGHADADWAGFKANTKSTSGYIFMVGGGPLNWCSKLQQTVALSSTEAEYKARTEAGQEATWLIDSLNFLGMEIKAPVVLHCDNLSAIHLTSKTIFHARTKHIEIQNHWI